MESGPALRYGGVVLDTIKGYQQVGAVFYGERPAETGPAIISGEFVPIGPKKTGEWYGDKITALLPTSRKGRPSRAVMYVFWFLTKESGSVFNHSVE